MQNDILIEMLEESSGCISTFEHFLEKSDNESVEQYNIESTKKGKGGRRWAGLPGN